MCIAALTQARNPIFYKTWGVPYTLEGRFDCACLHLSLLLRHLKKPLSQSVFDAFFSYTEMTLREVGVSDLRVGKQVQKCAKFFYGAMKAYHEALEGKENLSDALKRNLYGGKGPESFSSLIDYVLKCDQQLKSQIPIENKVIQWPILEPKD